MPREDRRVLSPTASAPDQRTLRAGGRDLPLGSGLLPGAALGHYRVVQRVGAGGMGVVYEAVDLRQGYHVALKLLYETDARGLVRLSREFRRMADISHPNLVALYELGGDRQHRFLAMEFIVGTDFVQGVRAGRRCDFGRLRAAVRQLTLGVHALHEHDRVHRDLKPSNVMIAADTGRVVILDFGLVDEIGRKTLLTSSMGLVQGTPAYMAPEQAAGQLATPASDWYAVGAMLHEAVTGSLPFSGALAEILLDKQFREPPPVSARVPEVPPELDRLICGLLARDPSRRPGAPELMAWCDGRLLQPERRARPPAAPGTGLVGLERARSLLGAALQQTIRLRQPVVVDVFGPSGTGKTALLDAFVADLRRREGAAVLVGRCYEHESVAYKAIDGLMPALARHLRRLPADELASLLDDGFPALVQLFPALATVEAAEPTVMMVLAEPTETIERAGPMVDDEDEAPDHLSELVAAFAADAAAQAEAPEPPEPADLPVRKDMSERTGSGEAPRARGVRALKQLLTRLALREQLVLVIDDLQWGDRDSARLLMELLAPPSPPALLFVGAWRSEDVDRSPLLGELAALRGSSTAAHASIAVETRPLGPEEAVRLALLRLGRDDVATQAQARMIAHESGGNPMLIEALVYHADPKLDPSSLRSTIGAQVPSLEQLLERRLRRLDPQAKEVLELVAISGQPVQQDLLGLALAGDLRPVLGQLRSERLIRTTSDDDPSVECYHDHIRFAALRGLASETLIDRHAALAAALQASGRDEPERLVRHLLAADLLERAASEAARAAAVAEQTGALARAASLYRLASACRAEDGALRRRTGEALVLAGRSAEAAPHFLAAAGHVGSAEAATLRRLAAEHFLISGHLREGLEVLRPLLVEIGAPYPENDAAVGTLVAGQVAALASRSLEFRERAEAEVPARELAAIDTCWIAGKGLLLADPLRGSHYMLHSAALALAAGEPRRIGRGLAVAASVAANRNAPEAKTWLAAAEQVAARTADSYTLGLVAVNAGLILRLAGGWYEAYEALEEGLQRLRASGREVAWECSLASSSLLVTLESLGELRALARESARLTQHAHDTGDLHTGVVAAIYAGLTLLARDEVGPARARVQHALAAWSGRGFQVHHLHALKLQVDCELYTGDVAAAWRRVVDAWPSIEQASFLRLPVRRMEALQMRTRAALAMLQHDPQGHAHLYGVVEADVEQIGREPMSYAPPLAALLRASLAAVRGDAAAALESLAPAIYGLETTNMTLHATVARRCKGQWIGGPQGEAIVAQADAYMRMQDIVAPARWAAMMAPGLVRAETGS